MGAFLLPVYLFVMTEPMMVHSNPTLVFSATGLISVTQADTYASVTDKDGPTSSTHVNTTEPASVILVAEPATRIESLLMYQVSVQLRRIYLPVLIAAGTFGNVIVVVIHCRLPPGQKSSMSVYFTALAISDSVVLWTGWFWVLQAFGITLSVGYHVQQRDYTHDVILDVLCRIRVWTSYAFSQVSSWILVSMTVHRTLSVVWPHKTRNILRKGGARKMVFFIVSFCTVTNAHTLYGHSLVPPPGALNGTARPRKAACFASFHSESYGEFFNNVWVWEDSVMAVLLPFACLIVTNTFLVRRVGQSLAEARETLAEGHRSDQQLAARGKKLSSMTVTVIATSVAFLLLTSPLAAYMIVQRALGRGGRGRDVRTRAADNLTLSSGLMTWYMNLAINFYIYCLTGARYRREFLRLFGWVGSIDTGSRGSRQVPSSD